ncbi:Tat pathway signal protein [Leptolyngbya cf. ectocarpi LEGE 11479]|uniref:Tat pathway signal protein n=1 Tax=Leptolyngbya cf. ectocarpi LEGE 11479 TaxID=1828722 RepID=A0A928ZYQ1_LEPEC|nr:Tat pathway signal protein [Leptolyngbya ectocarpi]MBE9069880.1 Tat pathway signal protein [Leptolyngbya cf. ectocarpi LEGE 11479]
MGYQDVVSKTWRHYDLKDVAYDYINLVRYATLAASSHNTQPWKFNIEPGLIWIFPDLTRRCPAVDPDDHHLYVSLGCAATNLIEAAAVAGLQSRVSFDQATSAVKVKFEEGPIVRSQLFEAIPNRQCSRTLYDGSKVTVQEQQQLKRAAKGNGVSVLLFTKHDQKETIANFVAKGNIAQMNDAGWIKELKSWIRFSESHAIATGDGLYGLSMGSPDVPKVIGDLILRLALTPGSQNKKDKKHILSSSGIAVFFSDVSSKAQWVEVGQCYERFALQATVLGLQTAFCNPPVEVPDLRAQFANWLRIGEGRPDLVVRFGRGPEMPHSLRRPLKEVVLGGSSIA